MARSVSDALLALIGFTSTPSDGATDWITANWPIPAGIVGSQRMAARVTFGAGYLREQDLDNQAAVAKALQSAVMFLIFGKREYETAS